MTQDNTDVVPTIPVYLTEFEFNLIVAFLTDKVYKNSSMKLIKEEGKTVPVTYDYFRKEIKGTDLEDRLEVTPSEKGAFYTETLGKFTEAWERSNNKLNGIEEKKIITGTQSIAVQ